MRIRTLLMALFLLTGCIEINTHDPTEVYKYWAGTEPANDLQVLNGQYWQSAHWSREYIMYLKLEATPEWWAKFLKQNLILDDTGKWTTPSDAPNWFTPSETSVRYKGSYDFDLGSRYFRDTLTDMSYIYEIQL